MPIDLSVFPRLTPAGRARFRLWHVGRKQLLNVITLQNGVPSVVSLPRPGGSEQLFYSSAEPAILLQWTGYQDATQKDLYEMDVVQVGTGAERRAGQHGVVAILDGVMMLVFGQLDEDGQAVTTLHDSANLVERVGNWYEIQAAQSLPTTLPR